MKSDYKAFIQQNGLALWLYDNTGLSFNQIQALSGCSPMAMHSIAQDTILDGIVPIDAIEAGLIDQASINFLEANPTALPGAIMDDQVLVEPIAKHAQRDDESPVVSQARTLAYMNYERNAWHSTWIGRYYTTDCLFSSLQAVKARAEKYRAPGNVFRIRFAQFLEIKTDARLVLVGSPWAHAVTWERLREIERLTDFPALISLLAEVDGNDLWVLASKGAAHIKSDDKVPKAQYESKARGAHRSLDWRSSAHAPAPIPEWVLANVDRLISAQLCEQTQSETSQSKTSPAKAMR